MSKVDHDIKEIVVISNKIQASKCIRNSCEYYCHVFQCLYQFNKYFISVKLGVARPEGEGGLYWGQANFRILWDFHKQIGQWTEKLMIDTVSNLYVKFNSSRKRWEAGSPPPDIAEVFTLFEGRKVWARKYKSDKERAGVELPSARHFQRRPSIYTSMVLPRWLTLSKYIKNIS